MYWYLCLKSQEIKKESFSLLLLYMRQTSSILTPLGCPRGFLWWEPLSISTAQLNSSSFTSGAVFALISFPLGLCAIKVFAIFCLVSQESVEKVQCTECPGIHTCIHVNLLIPAEFHRAVTYTCTCKRIDFVLTVQLFSPIVFVCLHGMLCLRMGYMKLGQFPSVKSVWLVINFLYVKFE